MGRASALVLGCVGVLGVTGVAGVVAGMNARGTQGASESVAFIGATPAEVVASRFPLVEQTPAVLVDNSPVIGPDDQQTLFSPFPFYPATGVASTASVVNVASAEPAPAPQQKPQSTYSVASVSPETQAPYKLASVTPEPVKAQVAKAEVKTEAKAEAKPAPRRAKPNSVLNDAQIASMKRRLNLTPDQEPLWPAVESALRNIAYAKSGTTSPVRTPQGAMAYIDPDSNEVAQLKYAALPLIMRLDDDQRREVRSMAHVMGLEGVASRF
jgi:hypothetical protein